MIDWSSDCPRFDAHEHHVERVGKAVLDLLAARLDALGHVAARGHVAQQRGAQHVSHERRRAERTPRGLERQHVDEPQPEEPQRERELHEVERPHRALGAVARLKQPQTHRRELALVVRLEEGGVARELGVLALGPEPRRGVGRGRGALAGPAGQTLQRVAPGAQHEPRRGDQRQPEDPQQDRGPERPEVAQVHHTLMSTSRRMTRMLAIRNAATAAAAGMKYAVSRTSSK